MDEPLKQDPGNLNKGTERGKNAIAKSIAAVGYGRSGVVTEDNVIIAGNHLFQAAVDRGDEPVIIDVDGSRPYFLRVKGLNSDDPKALQMAILDNQTNKLNYNPDLENTIPALQEAGLSPEDVGYTIEELNWKPDDQIDADASEDTAPDRGNDPDDRHGPAAPRRVEPGQIWELGTHRLICGDCRVPHIWRELLAEKRAKIVITSPPYADRRDYDASSGFKPIPPGEYLQFWDPIQQAARDSLTADGSFFVNIKPHCEDGERVLYVSDLLLAMARTWKWRFVDELCWVRHGPPGKWPNRLRNGWEPVYHFSNGSPSVNHAEIAYEGRVPVSSESGDGAHMDGHWNRSYECKTGTVYPDNVIEASGVEFNTGHTAPFPVKLPEMLIKAFSMAGDLIVDPFMGSGTSIIAAERTGRVGYGIELSPQACDITLERYEKRTGNRAKLLRTI